MAETLAPPVTFEELCALHGALLDAQAEDRLDPAEAESFVKAAAAAGVQIESIGDRDAIRSMINYWTAMVARLPAAPVSASPTDDNGGASRKTRRSSSTKAAAVVAPVAAPTPAIVRPVLATFDAKQSPSLDEKNNPFVGLAAFDSTDSANFFGRDKVVADLLQQVLAAPLVVVSGASGTGKSSLVCAGLVANVRTQPDTAAWLVAVASPGRDPVASLACALAPPEGASEWIERFREQVDADPAAAGPIVAQRMGAQGLLLVIDQMEELFSLCQPEDRDRAARAIAAIAALPQAHVVATIRDEYLETERVAHALSTLDLAKAVEFRVPPLQIEDIRAAIAGPAAKAGLVFQDGVIDRILADVGTDPAALPLLQYALLRLWKKRDGNRITMTVLDRVGGPSTALSNAAQEIYDGFGIQQAKENCRIVFQQLVRPSLVYEFVRDRVTRFELERLLPPESLKTVLTPYVTAALIRITPGSDRDADRIEIIHEALIRNWELLRRWSIEVRDKERAYLALDAQAQRWESSGRAAGHLLIGRALSEADKVCADYQKRARIDPVSDRRVSMFLAMARRVQRRLWVGIAVAAAVTLALIMGIVLLNYYISEEKRHNVEATRSYNTLDLRYNSLTSNVANLSEDAAQALDSSADSDAGRQFIQMLVSRGTISADELPPAFAGMTASAATWPALHAQPYPTDFLGLGGSIDPRVTVPGMVRLDLDHLRVFFDPDGGVPRLIVSQFDRTHAAYRGASNALYRWPGLSGQPDEIALAREGTMLVHLVDQREVAWGPTEASAEAAALGANLIATMQPAGRRGVPFSAWAATLAWMRSTHNPDADRVLFFTGAVPGEGTVGKTIPKLLWKIAVSKRAGGRLVADAVMLPAPSGAKASDIPGRTTIEAIAAATKIDFRALQRELVNHPAIAAAPAAAGGVVAPIAAQSTPSSVSATRVYVEVKGVGKDDANAVRTALAGEGFVVPQFQRVDPCVAIPELRYYFRQDAEAAARASSIAGAAIHAAGLGGDTVAIRRLDPNRYGSARPGTIELWFCAPGTAAQ